MRLFTPFIFLPAIIALLASLCSTANGATAMLKGVP